jgi:hypothetical protein
VADADEHVEIDRAVAIGRLAREPHGHEPVELAVDEQRGATRGRGGEVTIRGTVAELAKQRPRGVGIPGRSLRVRVALGCEEHEALTQERIEARPIGDAQVERQVDEARGADETCACRHGATSDRRCHQRGESGQAPCDRGADAPPRKRGVDEHERRDQIGTPGRDAGADEPTHRVAHDDRGVTALVEHRFHQLPVRRQRRRPVGRACSTEADQIDRSDGRAETVGEELAEGKPRDGVRPETVHQEDGWRVNGVARGVPVDGVDSHAVDLEAMCAAQLHLGASVFVVIIDEPNATWGVDFARDDGTAGFVRLVRVGDRCWCWAYLVGPDVGLVVVRDHDVSPPRRSEILDVRSEGLWMELLCETPGEHWTFGVEAFAVRLDHARDALHGEIGERLPMGCDLEWEVDGAARGSTGTVRGELLVGAERIEIDAPGVLRNALAPDTGWPADWRGRCRSDDGRWWQPSVTAIARSEAGGDVPAGCLDADGGPQPVEVLAVVPVPLGVGSSDRDPVLVRVVARLRGPVGGSGTGWLEMLQSVPGRAASG